MRRKLSAPCADATETSPTERTPGNAKSLLARHSPRSVPADGGSPSTCNVPGSATVEGSDIRIHSPQPRRPPAEAAYVTIQYGPFGQRHTQPKQPKQA